MFNFLNKIPILRSRGSMNRRIVSILLTNIFFLSNLFLFQNCKEYSVTNPSTVDPIKEVPPESTPISKIDDLSCNSKVHQDIQLKWNNKYKKYYTDYLINNLINKGDSYVLYNLQVYLDALLDMATRCNDYALIEDLKSIAEMSFEKLEPISATDSRLAWICRGGSTCTTANKLLNTEVQLNSIQYISFIMKISNALTFDYLKHSDFIKKTTRLAIDHMIRWKNSNLSLTVSKISNIDLNYFDSSDQLGSSAKFYSDRLMWVKVAIVEILRSVHEINNLDTNYNAILQNEKDELSSFLSDLVKLYLSRTTILTVNNLVNPSSQISIADLDTGRWRYYKDNRYANYSDPNIKPVQCITDPVTGLKSLKVNVPIDSVVIDTEAGWDISHARRFNHFFETFERNKNILLSTLPQLSIEINSVNNIKYQFLNSIIYKIWNQDLERPLFSNFWNGKNGWYRVAYDNGTGKCVEGTPPYGLTDSITGGNYFGLSKYNPQLKKLSEVFYKLSLETNTDTVSFLKSKYPTIANDSSLMFWPSIVGN